MNDRYEDAFRDAASHITTQPRPQPDDQLLAKVMARTTSTRRRIPTRPLRWLAAAAALVVTAGIVWTVARPVLPVTGIPAPVASPSATSGRASVTLDLDIDASLPYQDATFEVLRQDQDLTITVKATKDGKTTRTLGTYQSQADTVWSKKIDDDLQLALLPGYADQVTSLAGSLVHSQWLPGVAMTAVVVQHNTANPAQALIWRDNDHRIHNSLGSDLPSASLTVAGSNVILFEDLQLEVWGYMDIENDVRRLAGLGTEPVRKIRGLAATGSEDGSTFTDATWLAVLPTGGTDPKLDTQPGVTWDAAPIGTTGRIAILIHADQVKPGHTGINSISYTDQGGQRHTYTP
ncbi:MAG: hypothetical protein QM779_11615 [Propionicimonas sp.]|uniref:hypothetical protein n=1 Tax=Propionicimonas sp. TaxID=1955623 RepID=UPI003D09EE90